MANIEDLALAHSSPREFSKAYFDYLNTLLQSLDLGEIEAFVGELEAARRNNHTVFVVGNGGSAAAASHIGTDLSGPGFKAGSEKPLRVLSLADNTAMISAAANDFGYEQVFMKQLQLHYREGDLLLVISASGNSPNLIKAAEWMRERNGKVLGLLGFDGGKLKDLCTTAVIARSPKGDYGPVEDVHVILNHIFTLWLHIKHSKPR